MKKSPAYSTLLRLLFDDTGQDVVEYALLAALVGIAGILTWQVIADKVGIAYSEADSDVQSLASPPDPAGS